MNPAAFTKRVVRSAVNRCLHPLGYDIVRIGGTAHPNYTPYIDAATTVSAALAHNQTVTDYVESMWNEKGAGARTVDEMRRSGALAPCARVCEIGPGTGRFLDQVAKAVTPRQYDIYETDDGWATWLANTYSPPVVRQPTDGHTLSGTLARSCGLVHAHGVFVYLSLLHAVEYFLEMIRVCEPSGYVVFDYFPAEDWNETVVMQWLASADRFPVVLPRHTVLSFFQARRGTLLHEFDGPCGAGLSHYMVFRIG